MIQNPNYSEGFVHVNPGNGGSNSLALEASTQPYTVSASPRSTTSTLNEIVTAHHPEGDTLLHQPQDFTTSLSSIDAAAIYSMAQKKQFPQMPFPKK